MKHFLILFFANVLSFFAHCQLSEDFSDGNFSAQPVWSGSITNFVVENETLRSDGPEESAQIYLSTPVSLPVQMAWECWMRLDFNPSSSNYNRIYLVADQADLLAPDLNGYYIRIGENGADDSIDLFKQEGSAHTKILDGPDAQVALAPEVRLRIIRDENFNLLITADLTGGKVFSEPIGTFNGLSDTGPLFFGFLCTHTSTRRDKFFLDDIRIETLQTDTISPVVSSFELLSDSKIRLVFSEPMDPSSFSLQSLRLLPEQHALQMLQWANTNQQVDLVYEPAFRVATTYELIISDITDLSGNSLVTDTVFFTYIPPYRARFGDVVINEIMADPSPVRGLPEAEYLELFNTTGQELILTGWRLNNTPLPEINLPPDGYVLLYDEQDGDAFSAIGCCEVSGFPTLTNGGMLLELISPENQIIDYVRYSDQWHRAFDKREGGWSLERLDPSRRCDASANWNSSMALRGGTPGALNTVYAVRQDLLNPILEEAFLFQTDSIMIRFSEPVQLTRIDPNDITINPEWVFSLRSDYPFSEIAWLILEDSAALDSPTELSIRSFLDCAGNVSLEQAPVAIDPVRPATPEDLRINEILFNPFPGGVDFLEVFNEASATVNLSGWRIANGFADKTPNELVTIGSDPLILPPQGYLAFTEDPSRILADYPQSPLANLYQLDKLPAFPDEAGTAFLFAPGMLLADSCSYSESDHLSLLTDDEGVALERLDRTSGQTSWVSAAATVGYATPGRQNSHSSLSMSLLSNWSVLPPIFSPNGDGMDDFVEISYSLDQPVALASITIYDVQGKTIRSLISQQSIPEFGTFIWDGTDAHGSKARVGYYIIKFEMIQATGTIQNHQETVALVDIF